MYEALLKSFSLCPHLFITSVLTDGIMMAMVHLSDFLMTKSGCTFLLTHAARMWQHLVRLTL